MKYSRSILSLVFVVSGILFLSCDSSHQDDYIRSLRADAVFSEPIDSLCLEAYDEISVDEILAINDSWFLLSSRTGNYNLLFLDAVGKQSFYAIRKGRGPMEMINGGSLHQVYDKAVYYDMTTSCCVSIDLLESIRLREVVLDTLCDFSTLSPKPVYMTRCRYGYVSGNVSDSGVWYSLYSEDGSLSASVDALEYDELTQDRDLRISVMLSSKYASSPDGSRVCVANVASPSLSFAEVNKDDLTEYMRYEISPPDINGGISPDNCSAFMDVVADDEYVYLLYSGRSIKSRISDSCNHIVIYRWDGSFEKYLYLKKPVCSICIDKECFWGISPDGDIIYKYNL